VHEEQWLMRFDLLPDFLDPRNSNREIADLPQSELGKFPGAMVEVFNEKTGKFARMPLVDVGPREDLEAELDLTFSVDEHLGNGGSARVLFRVT